METKNFENVMERIEKFTNAGTLVGNAVMIGSFATIHAGKSETHATIFADSYKEMLNARKHLLKYTANATKQDLERITHEDGTKFYTWTVTF
jgi:hypothetical protein